MKPNLHAVDRVLRIIIAAVCAVLFFTKTVVGTGGLILLIAGGVILATAVISFCPIYRILGISTAPKD